MKYPFMRNYLKKGLMVSIMILALLPCRTVFGDELAPGVQGTLFGEDMLAEIQRMEAQLLRPCDNVEAIMNDLIKYGKGYLAIEEERAKIYSEWSGTYLKGVSDFIIVADGKGTAAPGVFVKEFLELKKIAEEGGVLAEGPRPDMALIKLAHSKSSTKYFYFDEPGSAAAKNKLELRRKLEDEYEKLTGRWKKARDEFYKQFDDSGAMKRFAGALEEKTKEGREYSKKYSELRKELTALATSGDYEHCLGKIKPLSYTIGDPDELSVALYSKGQDGTPGGLPGMGFKIVAMKDYKAVTRPDIGDFPFALYLKRNAKEYLKLEKELLEIKIKAEEEETSILGMGMGRLGEFGFKVTQKTAQGLAAPIKIVEYVASHPINSFNKAVDFVKNSPKMIKAIGDIDLIKADKKASEFITGNTEKLFMGLGEIARDLAPVTWDRFDPKPGETPEQEITRLQAKLDSTKKVKEGIEVSSSIVSLAAEAILDKGITKGLGVKDKLIEGMKIQDRATDVLRKIDAVQDQARTVKAAGAVSDELEQSAKTVKELAEEQLKVNKQLQDLITGTKEKAPGNMLPAEQWATDPLRFKDKAGNAVDIPVGKMSGEGATSKAFQDATDDSLIVRVTPLYDESVKKTQLLDEYGRKVLEEDVKSSFVRTANREKVMEVVNETGIAQHVEYVEKVKPAKKWLEEQGGKLTDGQKLALEQATRDINAKGYTWVDNHVDNYAFEKLPGEERYKVVIFDTGGIYPMKGANAAEKAANARNLQVSIIENENKLKSLPESMMAQDMYANMVRSKVWEVGGDPLTGIDIEKVGLKKVENIGVGGGRDMRPDVGDIYKKSDGDFFNEVESHTSKAILNDPAFKELKTKYDQGQAKLNEAIAKVDPQLKQTEKAMEGGPKASPEPDKPSGIDKDVADKANFLSQIAAKTVNEENCAILRKAFLAGSKDQWLADAMKDCARQGF